MSAPANSVNEPYFQRDFALGEFRARREAVARAIGDGVAILQGLPDTGAFSVFRQHNDFFYLCGVEVPHAYLTIDGRDGRSVLHLLPHDEASAKSEGQELNATDAETALRITGVDEVRPTPELLDLIPRNRTYYLCHAPTEGRQACQDTLRHARSRAASDPLASSAISGMGLVDDWRVRWPEAEIRDLSPILTQMRLYKSPAELALMRRAGALAAQAVIEAIRATAPGMFEYQLAAVADYLFFANGARGGAYRPIVASGPNIWNMHYWRNDSRLEEGELVLMDYAPDLGNYTSDIGRMWPVSGRYSAPQRELYGFVVDYHLTLLELIAPGRTPEEICRQAADRLRPQSSRTRWSKTSYRDAVEALLESGKPFTHPVGMAVHDVGEYRREPLRPGLVFALDPQLWVPDEQRYIRIEDAVAVTAGGVENFTQLAPHDLDEVERMIGCERTVTARR